MVQFDELVCPVEYSLRKDELLNDGCMRNPVFLLAEYNLPKFVQSISRLASILCTLSRTMCALVQMSRRKMAVASNTFQ